MTTIKPKFGQYTVYASDYLLLDSDVINGGGTNQTLIVQEILDKALEWGGLYLEMDGAALVSRLIIHSNTTIKCTNSNCGFFQDNDINNSLLQNNNLSFSEINTENIALIGGTYNFNSPNQQREDIQPDKFECGCVYDCGDKYFTYETGFFRFLHTNMGFKFCGIRNLTINGIRTINQRIYAMYIACFEHITIENTAVELTDNRFGQNQDGLHFHGPGRDLAIRNVRGCSGDDFIALAPDEFDFVSDITDVVIDGVYLEDADQGIRLLSRAKGRLDRVFIRNVYGTYKSFGFFINPWYGVNLGNGEGNYGGITFENIQLEQTYHKYHIHGKPFLFRIGGKIESLTLKNIKAINPNDSRALIDVSGYYCHPGYPYSFADIANLTIDGLEITNKFGTENPAEYIIVDAKVDNLIIKNTVINRAGNSNNDTLLAVNEGAEINNLVISNVLADGIEKDITVKGGKIKNIYTDNIHIND